tara:strand:- start:2259 stop:2456 length:198 start_codon:yes stop_codon:yes gene_type:complete
MNKMALKGLLAEKLEAHDWYYSYSDDFKEWKKGSEERSELRSLVKALGEEGAKMYHTHASNYPES